MDESSLLQMIHQKMNLPSAFYRNYLKWAVRTLLFFLLCNSGTQTLKAIEEGKSYQPIAGKGATKLWALEVSLKHKIVSVGQDS